MPSRADILDERDSLRTPFAGSVALHAAVFGLFAIYGMHLSQSNKIWGVPNPRGGAAVNVDVVRSIPLPNRHGPVNPVANDTESQVPQQPKQEIRKAEPVPKPDAVALPSRVPKRTTRDLTAEQKYRPRDLERTNQVYGREAPAARSPIFQLPGSGSSIGIGENSPLGSQFGAYAALIIRRVGEHWRTTGLEGVQAPFVVATFELQRDGGIRNPQLVQRSGNSTLDYSALRAITEAAPYPPLPAENQGNVATAALKFHLKR